MMSPYDRRKFLSALGALAFTGGISARARAEAVLASPPSPKGEEPPLRFFGVYTPHGSAYEYYPPGEGFDFTYEHAVLSPFEDEKTYGKKYKEYLTIVDGVDLSAGLLTGTVGHEAPRVILTGSGADGLNASIDQYLAVEQGFGASTIVTSLVLGVGNDASGPGNNVSYARGGTELPKQIDPRSLFADLFGTPISGKTKDVLQQERALGLSILDFARRDLKTIRRSSPSSARLKLEQHETALRDIEKRLTTTAPACDRPMQPREFSRLKAYGGGEPDFDEITNLMIDLSVRAMACDLTRFASIFLADLSRTRMGHGLPPDIHQGVAHKYQARSVSQPGRPESWQALANQNRYTYSKVVRLAQRMDEAGILDDSIVYASSDLGDPARHSSRHVPTLLVGRAGGRWPGGKYIRFDSSNPIANNRVLVSIAQAFGVETERFGHSASSSVVTGNISAQLAART